ncbi:hypothetical protein [Clostridium sp. BJN0001]|uniref:hypothetical protein n=1 Tax=Clostridium sp. BJN0001 TaxID=2930219 RepID=UPI001FD40AA4|nr:hypothetical protein [Clostridium sp. BJN0001]
MKSLSKRIIGVLMIASTFTTLVPSVGANAATIKNKNTIELNETKKSDSSSEVIAYLDGQAITKNDVDENGMITKDFSKSAKKSSNINKSSLMRSYSNSIPNTLPSRYDEVTIVKDLINVPRFSQTTIDMYLTTRHARELANKFDVSSIETIASFIFGLFPGMQVPSLELLLSQGQRSETASDIRNYTDDDEQVRLRIIHTSYGTLYRVDYWNGHELDTSLHSEKVVSISYN